MQMKYAQWNKIINKHIEEILSKCIKKDNFDTQKILECLSLVSSHIEQIKQNLSSDDIAELSKEDKEAINEIKRKSPKWFANPNKKVSIILLTFLQLSNVNQKDIPLDTLIDECLKNKRFNSKQNIKNNYSKMKSAKGKPDGKIFDEDKKTRKVKLWDKAAHIILQEYEKYLKKGVRQ